MNVENKTLGQSIIEHALNDAIEKYYENPSEDSFHLICNQLVVLIYLISPLSAPQTVLRRQTQ